MGRIGEAPSPQVGLDPTPAPRYAHTPLSPVGDRGNRINRGKMGDTPKPPAGRTLHPMKEEDGGHPQTPGREDRPPSPLVGINGDTSKPPAGEGPCTPIGSGWGTPPNPQQGEPCTPYLPTNVFQSPSGGTWLASRRWRHCSSVR